MKKFQDKEKTIFDNVSLLEDLLIEYEDIGFNYKICYGVQYNPQGDGMYPVGYSNNKDVWTKGNKTDGTVYLTYIINFESELLNVITSDFQRSGRGFGDFNDLQKVINITTTLKNKIESMGFTMLISFDKNPNDPSGDRFTTKLSIMILNKVIN